MALTGHELVVAAGTWRPYAIVPEGAEEDPTLVTGIAFDAFKIIANRLNFT